jgi:hypothetical protein
VPNIVARIRSMPGTRYSMNKIANWTKELGTLTIWVYSAFTSHWCSTEAREMGIQDERMTFRPQSAPSSKMLDKLYVKEHFGRIQPSPPSGVRSPCFVKTMMPRRIFFPIVSTPCWGRPFILNMITSGTVTDQML